MAFKKFVAPERVKGVKAENREERRPWAKFITNGSPSSVLLIFGASATKQYELAEGDRIDLFYDEETGRVGVRKNPDGAIALLQHGDSKSSLKAACSAFYRTHLGHLTLPYKADATRGARGMISFSTTEGDPAKGRKKVARKATTKGARKAAGSRTVEKSAAPVG